MNHIDTGDLTVSGSSGTRQGDLFEVIREKIIQGNWKKGDRLPPTRKLAEELELSRNTVIAAYEQLSAEGYLQSRRGSGYYVSVSVPEHYLETGARDKTEHNQGERPDKRGELNLPFSPGVPDLNAFPYKLWNRILNHHLSRSSLSGIGDLQGLYELRLALSAYLTSSRSVDCHPDRIIITSGAQQALFLAITSVLNKGDRILMEDPGYSQMRKVLKFHGAETSMVPVRPREGVAVDQLISQSASAVYLTPSNQYPMGSSLNTEDRLRILQWAGDNRSWVIEDDYDSEFQFAHRPYASLQGLAAESSLTDRCIYIGSFSKTMFNGLRIGYMVVPDSLTDVCLSIKEATGGMTSAHYQAALAEFISEGHFLRHLRKMRRLYQQKQLALSSAVSTYFPSEVEIISQAAGLHATLKWNGPVNEVSLVQEAGKEGIVVRPLSYYESGELKRDWQSVVIGYGNASLEQIPILVRRLAVTYSSLAVTA